MSLFLSNGVRYLIIQAVGGIWNSTIAEFGMKFYLRAEFSVQDHTRERNERIIKGGTRNECKIFLVAREVREELPRIDNYLYHCAVVCLTS